MPLERTRYCFRLCAPSYRQRNLILGEEFEDKEEELFGEGGFEKVVAEVAELEKRLGIYELAQFTPPK